MIRITRGAAPEVLLTAGAAACETICAQATQEGEHYRLRFESGIYGHTSVHAALAVMQAGKCCYCESKIDRGTVDHYRPKGAIYQAPGERVSARGYYWLAYAWENLLLACNDCNTRFKRELFPLKDPSCRILSHQSADQIGREEPLLLDPTQDDPEEHIMFHGPTPVALTRRGRTTIEVLQLDRPFLEDERQQSRGLLMSFLTMLEALRAGMTVPDEIARGACEQIARLSTASRPYTGVIRSVLRQYFGADVELPLTAERLLEWVMTREAAPER